jgi:hypothetical protein
LRWTCKSTAQLAAALPERPHPVSDRPVAAWLKSAGSSLPAHRKTQEGASPPDRNAPFEERHERGAVLQKPSHPGLSVDPKKKE